MAYSPKDIDDRWSSEGSISSLNAIDPSEINDAELSYQWGKALDALRAFERQEDAVVAILDRLHAQRERP